MGGQTSKLKEELQQAQQQLAAAEERSQALQAELNERVVSQEATILQKDADLATAARECAQRLEAKQLEVLRAVKAKEVAEELRRADALLVKRVTAAVLRKSSDSKDQQQYRIGNINSGLVDGAMAAQLAIASDSEAQLRQALHQAASSLKSSEHQLEAHERLGQSELRRELCGMLGLPELCDASLSLRSSDLMVVGGLRFPKEKTPTCRASGLSAGVGVLRNFGALSTVQGSWTSVGGSMLWDARERELAALRIAVCMQPAPSQLLRASFDHTGVLSASAKTAFEDFSLRLTGSFDLNRSRRSTASVHVAYDLD